eukprot:1179489-Prorocentrum_minimum.AAC.1
MLRNQIMTADGFHIGSKELQERPPNWPFFGYLGPVTVAGPRSRTGFFSDFGVLGTDCVALETSLWHCTVSRTVHCETALCHSADYTVSRRRLHRVALETTPCHSADYTVSLWRLHRVTPQTRPCRSADYTVSLWRLHYVTP